MPVDQTTTGCNKTFKERRIAATTGHLPLSLDTKIKVNLKDDQSPKHVSRKVLNKLLSCTVCFAGKDLGRWWTITLGVTEDLERAPSA